MEVGPVTLLPGAPDQQNIIARICQARVETLARQGYLKQLDVSLEQLTEHVIRIVKQNQASGRLRRVILWQKLMVAVASNDPLTGDEEIGFLLEQSHIPLLQAYLDRVTDCYLKEYRRIEKLAASDTTEWMELFGELAKRADQILLRQKSATKQDAVDFAHEACLAIFNCPFPYDVPFVAWATKILINIMLRRYTRSQDLIDCTSENVSLDCFCLHEIDDPFSLYDLLIDQSGKGTFGQVEVQDWLIQAIAQLPSSTQQQVIIDTIFNSLSDEQIAQGLGKTKNAVQILRQRALHQLRQFLGE